MFCYDADFYPYGAESNVTNTCSQNYKWTGKERDAETGNDNFDARYYSSTYGRFLSADWSAVPAPVPYANLTNPQTLNLYAIVRDNPETYVDLDGHLWTPGATGQCGDATSGCGGSKTVTTTNTTVTPWGQAFQGQGAASVTTTQTTTTTTTASDGSVTTSQTKTETSAYYSLKDGGYLGATQKVTSVVTTGDGQQNTTITQANIGMGSALSVIGSAGMARAAELAHPGRATGFMMATNADAKRHPAKYAAAGFAIGELFLNPPKGLRDAVDVIAAGAFAIADAWSGRNEH